MKQNKTTLVLTMIVFILGGLLLLYRGQNKVEDWDKFNGTITNVNIKEFAYKSGFRYSLDFDLKETENIYGIYLGTKEQAETSQLKNKIEINRTYTFYVDQTVSSSNGHILGIRIIENDGQTIYRENSKANFIAGSLFLTMGVGTLLILILWDKRRR